METSHRPARDTQTMRAVVVRDFGDPSVLKVEELVMPHPGAGEVAIDVAFAGTGFVDTLFRAGAFPLELPFTPGIEVTGTVREIGAGVEGLRAGQPVAALLNDFGRTQRIGGYAEVAVAHGSMVAALPPDSDLPRMTAVLINGVTAWIALRELARAKSTDTVVVLGASGGLGGTTARLAAVLPCHRIIGVAGRDPSRAPEACTEAVLNEDFEAWAAEPENRPDIVIDPVGGRLRGAAFEALRPFGRLIVLGNASGEDPGLSGDAAWHGTRLLAGLSLGATAHLNPAAIQEALHGLIDLVARGALPEPAPEVRSLSEVREVHERFADRTAPAKTVLDLSAGR